MWGRAGMLLIKQNSKGSEIVSLYLRGSGGGERMAVFTLRDMDLWRNLIRPTSWNIKWRPRAAGRDQWTDLLSYPKPLRTHEGVHFISKASLHVKALKAQGALNTLSTCICSSDSRPSKCTWALCGYFIIRNPKSPTETEKKKTNLDFCCSWNKNSSPSPWVGVALTSRSDKLGTFCISDACIKGETKILLSSRGRAPVSARM